MDQENKMPNIPEPPKQDSPKVTQENTTGERKEFYNNKSKHILAIAFGIISVLLAAFGYIHWCIYIFSVGFALASILFALKYFEIEKISIIATIIALSTALVVGYSIIRTGLVEIGTYFTTQQYTETYNTSPFDEYNDNSNMFGGNDDSSIFGGNGESSNDSMWD